MAHYAFLQKRSDGTLTVVDVITGKDEDQLLDGMLPEDWYAAERGMRCVRTSYNGKIRKNFAGIGYTYDEARDAFIPPKPYQSWTLDDETCCWVPPVPRPSFEVAYIWNENRQLWETIGADSAQSGATT